MSDTRVPSRPTPPVARDEPLDRRLVLSSLWISMLFVFVYVDLFAFYRADVIEAALAGEVAGVGFTVGQTFLALVTLYVLVPSLMVVGCLLLPRRYNRLANLVLATVYALTIVGATVGETWVYFMVGSGVELVLLGVVVRVAHRWR
ncbi:MAG: hypothetical protein CMH83_02585 [Nocardioides sp.]|nr:hypothetical protein [Nocardioides sp.]